MPASEPLIAALYGGPGTGKSTTTAELFARFKRNGVNCEYVHEVAKDFTWENREFALSHQPYLITKQLRNYDRLYGKVDLILTDTSPMLASIYAHPDLRGRGTFLDWIEEDWEARNTLDIFLKRDPHREYNPHGRSQTKEEAELLDDEIENLNVRFRYVPVDMQNGTHVGYIEEIISKCLPR
jgi:nicotinamide riboside kinase